MKGDLSIEYVGKWVVLIIVLAVCLLLLKSFSDSSEGYLKDISEEEYNTSSVTSESFSQSQMELYVRSCWLRAQESNEKDRLCYILEGNMDGIDAQTLEEEFEEYGLDASGFDRKKAVATIEYSHIFRKIVLKN
ncbi:MAG: hypothetical protein ACP5E4_00190 [Candidatus Aenigmatarchaeota archaeon]